FARDTLQLADRVAAFDAAFDEERARFAALDLRLLSPQSLDRTLRDVERLLAEAGGVMLTAYGNLLLNVLLLRSVLRVAFKEEADSLERDLRTGLADVGSAAPGLALWHIAQMLKADTEAR